MTSSNAYMRVYLRARYRKRRALALEVLGGKCKCGSRRGLEVDHVDPTKKTMSFDRMYKVSLAKFMDELKRCQLLCVKCHTNKTSVDNGWSRRAHGNIAMYRHGGCRCDACRAAWSVYQRQRREDARVA